MKLRQGDRLAREQAAREGRRVQSTACTLSRPQKPRIKVSKMPIPKGKQVDGAHTTPEDAAMHSSSQPASHAAPKQCSGNRLNKEAIKTEFNVNYFSKRKSINLEYIKTKGRVRGVVPPPLATKCNKHWVWGGKKSGWGGIRLNKVSINCAQYKKAHLHFMFDY
jgi:hypothetical protein